MVVKMINDLSITKKLYLQGLIQFVIVSVIGLVSLFYLNKLGTTLHEIAKEDIPLTKMLTKATEHQLEQAIYIERMFLTAALSLNNTNSTKLDLSKSIDKVTSYQKLVHLEVDTALDFAKLTLNNLENNIAVQKYRILISDL
jgi:methyl-accepting chemotaxis protein